MFEDPKVWKGYKYNECLAWNSGKLVNFTFISQAQKQH